MEKPNQGHRPTLLRAKYFGLRNPPRKSDQIPRGFEFREHPEKNAPDHIRSFSWENVPKGTARLRFEQSILDFVTHHAEVVRYRRKRSKTRHDPESPSLFTDVIGPSVPNTAWNPNVTNLDRSSSKRSVLQVYCHSRRHGRREKNLALFWLLAKFKISSYNTRSFKVFFWHSLGGGPEVGRRMLKKVEFRRGEKKI